MNAERLLQLYDRVSEAPDAIPRLRRFILDLAVRGKLVSQDSHEEASLGNLSSARQRLEEAAATTKRLRWKPSTHVLPEQTAKSLPPGWVFARVNDTGLYINGLAFKPTDWKQTGLPIIRIQNLTDPAKEFNFAEGEFPDEVIVRDGDLLVSWSATLEAFKWDRGIGVLNQHIFRVIPDEGLTARPFLLLLLRNAIREMAESEHAHGLAMMHINRGPFLEHIVLVPPIAEQHRIVAKFDELMALCDSLEAERWKREATRDRLATASLSRLTAKGVDEEQFKAHADFAIKALPELTTRPDQIKVLRQTIHDLAVRGKLVEQDPNEKSASEMLKAIAAERELLEEVRQVKRGKPLPEVSGDEKTFEEPAGWAWARLAEISSIRQGFAFSSNDFSKLETDGPPLVRIGDIGSTSSSLYIRGKFDPAYLVESGDLLLGLSGSIKCAFWRGPEALLNQRIARIRPNAKYLTNEWLFLIVNESLEKWKTETSKLTVQNIKAKQLNDVPVPIPPLAEQRRIALKVDELISLCDKLGQELHFARQTRQQLLGALLMDALEVPLMEAT